MVAPLIALPQRALWAAEALAAIGVIVAGKIWLRWALARAERLAQAAGDACRKPDGNGG
jgi:hypothetical protein